MIALARSIHVAIAGVVLAACGTGVDPIDADAAPIVDAVAAAPEPQRWSFSYRATSSSPYISCLNGIDQVSGTIDLSTGVVLVEPDRLAPAILVTESTIMVANDPEAESWSESAWQTGSDRSQLVEVFGQIAAGYIDTGLRAPDPNMTSLAFIGIADRVEAVETRHDLSGQTISVTLNKDRYLAELAAGGDLADTEGGVPIPTIRITVGSDGRVTALEVRIDGQASEAHEDSYVTTFQYGESQIDVPRPELVERVPFSSLQYPQPASSCRFQS